LRWVFPNFIIHIKIVRRDFAWRYRPEYVHNVIDCDTEWKNLQFIYRLLKLKSKGITLEKQQLDFDQGNLMIRS
jgi:hypothetical protein